MKTFIYTLSDSKGVRYIGKANDPFKRYDDHLKEAKYKRTKKEKWIFSLLNKKEKPIIELLDEIENYDWGYWERYWISQFKTWGFLILNGTDGGEGSNGFKGKKHSLKTKQKCREAASNRNIINPTRMIGEDNASAKLKLNQVNEIKKKSLEGQKRKDLAKEYNVSRSTITLIVNGKRWNK